MTMRPDSMRPAVSARLRPWPLDHSIVHLVLHDVDMIPTTDDVDQWVADAFGDPTSDVRRIRTGAMFPVAAEAFVERGFVVAERLALLERPLIGPSAIPRHGAPRDVSITRLRSRDRVAAADVDQAAFPHGWSHTDTSLTDIAAATPQVHQRLAVSSRRTGRRTLGFSITGKAGTVGYLQRIAVHPDARRHGIAAAFVDDALGWLMRRGAARALVNTGVTNIPALRLYEATGFERRADELVVLDLTRTT